MKKVKCILTGTVFSVAVCGALASSLFADTTAFIHKADYPYAEITDPECIPLGTCDGQFFPCEIVFTGPPKKLYTLDYPDTFIACTIELRGEFIADTENGH